MNYQLARLSAQCSRLTAGKINQGDAMRLMTGAIAMVMAGCAGTPSPKPAPVTVASQAPAVTQTNAAPDPQAAGSDAQRASHAKKLGLTVMTVNGEVLYCRTERKTGSHLATETSCYNEQQLDDLHEQTRQGMEQIQRPMLPKSSN
jgi:hypothetical protein